MKKYATFGNYRRRSVILSYNVFKTLIKDNDKKVSPKLWVPFYLVTITKEENVLSGICSSLRLDSYIKRDTFQRTMSAEVILGGR